MTSKSPLDTADVEAGCDWMDKKCDGNKTIGEAKRRSAQETIEISSESGNEDDKAEETILKSKPLIINLPST